MNKRFLFFASLILAGCNSTPSNGDIKDFLLPLFSSCQNIKVVDINKTNGYDVEDGLYKVEFAVVDKLGTLAQGGKITAETTAATMNTMVAKGDIATVTPTEVATQVMQTQVTQAASGDVVDPLATLATPVYIYDIRKAKPQVATVRPNFSPAIQARHFGRWMDRIRN